MNIILEVKSKLPGNKGSHQLEVPKGISAGTILELLHIAGDRAEILIVYNGKAVYADDCLSQDGEIMLLPMLCGG